MCRGMTSPLSPGRPCSPFNPESPGIQRNLAHIRQSRPDYGLGFKVKMTSRPFQMFPLLTQADWNGNDLAVEPREAMLAVQPRRPVLHQGLGFRGGVPSLSASPSLACSLYLSLSLLLPLSLTPSCCFRREGLVLLQAIRAASGVRD